MCIRDRLFINVPRAYNFDTLTQDDCNALIEKKVEKEANRFIQQWPSEKISIENGRWGPFIRFGKKMLKITAGPDGKYTPEQLASIDIDTVKKTVSYTHLDVYKRQVVDRLVGFELSPVLWRKIGQQGGLSAGRVQSVAVKLIAEKEREINSFVPVSSFKIEASFASTDLNNRQVNFKAEGPRQSNTCLLYTSRCV